MKKLLFLIIFTIIPLLLCGVSCSQKSPYAFGGGSGSAEDPYQIATAEDLMLLSEYVNQINTSAHFKLTADIDMTDSLWTPIGRYFYGNSDNPLDFYHPIAFHGVLDGNGHIIKNLTINTSSERAMEQNTSWQNIQAAFIGFAAGTQDNPTLIKNLTLENVHISIDSYGYESAYASSFVGMAGTMNASQVTIENCHVTGMVRGGNESSHVAGFAAENHGDIINCSFEGVLECAAKSNEAKVGGFAVKNAGNIDRCSAGSMIIVNPTDIPQKDTQAILIDGFIPKKLDFHSAYSENTSISNSSVHGNVLAIPDTVEAVNQIEVEPPVEAVHKRKEAPFLNSGIEYDNFRLMDWAYLSLAGFTFGPKGESKILFLKGGSLFSISDDDDSTRNYLTSVDHILSGDYQIEYLLAHGTDHLEIYMNQMLGSDEIADIKAFIETCYGKVVKYDSNPAPKVSHILLHHLGGVERFEVSAM